MPFRINGQTLAKSGKVQEGTITAWKIKSLEQSSEKLASLWRRGVGSHVFPQHLGICLG